MWKVRSLLTTHPPLTSTWHAWALASLAGLHHVTLSVSNLDDSVQWYRDVLGLEEMFRQDFDDRRMVVLQFPGTLHTLGLVEHQGAVPGFDPHTIGLDHLAFSVTSGEELAAWPDRLNERGVTHSGPVETPFGGMLNFEDLNGIALALFWERGS